MLGELTDAREDTQPLHALHHHEHGGEEEQCGPFDAVHQVLHVIAIQDDQQQDHAQQSHPTEGQGSPMRHGLDKEADYNEDQGSSGLQEQRLVFDGVLGI